ncbi:hypothetical protein LZP73_18985 [Shewanella sp. AS16]|uniref:hypothetical protein n=1 Tax=Shewanella sp. AS16 TaxID=2907625 RepID=UPI001F235AD7|nr:hypothetical protein [Shewanella sp. AS16]MCE9688259.1 hypothetical protein [Shewanella sp. AS16]
MLYDPERHQTIPAADWSEEMARKFMSSLFNSTEDVYLAHDWSNPFALGALGEPQYEFHMYGGLAGVIWSQTIFEHQGYGAINSNCSRRLKFAKAQQRLEIEKEMNFGNADAYSVGLFIADSGFTDSCLPNPAIDYCPADKGIVRISGLETLD